MHFLEDGRVVVISCEAEITNHYTHHRPVPDQFTVAAPYQAPAATAAPLPSPKAVREEPAVRRPDGFLRANVPFDSSAQLPEVTQSEPPKPEEHQAAKPCTRKRKRPYQPNAQDLRHAVRHAAFQPALSAAEDTIRRWMVASGSPTISVALQRCGIECESQTRHGTSQKGEGTQPLPALPSSYQEEQHTCAANGALENGNSASSPVATSERLDYIALAASRKELRPKFYAALSEERHTGSTAAQNAGAADAYHGRPKPPHRIEVTDKNAAAGLQSLLDTAPNEVCTVNLLNKVIRNKLHRDLTAVAHEAAVVMPPCSAFLMSDIKCMTPLLQGAPL